MSSQADSSALRFRLLANPQDWQWLAAAEGGLQEAHADEDCKDADAIFLPGSGDLRALEHLQTLGGLYPRKPIILLLPENDSDQETAAIELGAFDVWTPEIRIGPAFARLRNQIAMLRGSSGRKRIHSPFLRRKQRLLQTLLSVVERPDEFRVFVQDFFSGLDRLRADAHQEEILKRLQGSSQDWGLDFLQRRLSATPDTKNISLAAEDMKTFLKTHEKLFRPILNPGAEERE